MPSLSSSSHRAIRQIRFRFLAVLSRTITSPLHALPHRACKRGQAMYGGFLPHPMTPDSVWPPQALYLPPFDSRPRSHKLSHEIYGESQCNQVHSDAPLVRVPKPEATRAPICAKTGGVPASTSHQRVNPNTQNMKRAGRTPESLEEPERREKARVQVSATQSMLFRRRCPADRKESGQGQTRLKPCRNQLTLGHRIPPPRPSGP